MTFLNAVMLLGIAAAAIPVLIHLFHRQRVSTVDFSSIVFIKQLNLRQSRALKLRQLLLLIVRTLIILLVVFAFARPVLEGALGAMIGAGVHQKTAVAIVLDNSYSMRAGGDASSSFAFALETAHRIVGRLQDGDEAVVVFTGSPPKAMPERPVLSLDRIRAVLDAAAPSARAGDIGAAMILASSLLANTSTLNREIYLITDLQKHDWQPLIDETIVPNLAPDIAVFTLPVSPPPVANASLDAVRVSGHLVETRQPETVVVTATNRMAAPLKDRMVDIYLNDIKRGSQTISIDPGKTRAVRFGLTIDRPGHYAGYVELEGDDLLIDNRRYFTLSIPERLSVLAVAGYESGYFIQQVLSPTGGISTPVDVVRASETALNGTNIDAQVIILDGELPLSRPQLSNLDRFVTAGGGLIVFLGEGVNAASYNTDLLPNVFACTIQGQIGTPGQRQSYVSLGQIDYDHPLFEVFQQRDGRLPDAPRFFSSYRLTLNPRTRVIASFTDGVPAIVEGRHGRGKALLIASALNARWSDLPLKSLFVPLIHRGIRYVHPDFDASEGETLVGTPVEIGVNWSDSDPPITMVLPSGATESGKPAVSGGGMSVVAPRTDEPGIYRIRSGNRLLSEFAVNVDTNESVFEWIGDQEISRLLNHDNVRVLPPDASLEQEILQTQQGYEIWRFLLWMALCLTVVETLLARAPVKSAQS